MLFSSFWRIREVFTNITIIYISLIQPSLKSIEAIYNKDSNTLKVLLSYWITLVLLYYTLYIISILQHIFHQNQSKVLLPEVKIILLIYLNYYQGSLLLINHIILPIFLKYEKQLDEYIDTITYHIQRIINRHIQHILWQIIFSPQDGLTSYIYYWIRPFTSYTLNTYNFLLNYHHLKNTNETNTLESKSIHTTHTNTSSINLSKLLLKEFSDLLRIGFIMYTGIHIRHMIPTNIQLSSNGKKLLFTEFIHSSENSDINMSVYNTADTASQKVGSDIDQITLQGCATTYTNNNNTNTTLSNNITLSHALNVASPEPTPLSPILPESIAGTTSAAVAATAVVKGYSLACIVDVCLLHSDCTIIALKYATYTPSNSSNSSGNTYTSTDPGTYTITTIYIQAVVKRENITDTNTDNDGDGDEIEGLLAGIQVLTTTIRTQYRKILLKLTAIFGHRARVRSVERAWDELKVRTTDADNN